MDNVTLSYNTTTNSWKDSFGYPSNRTSIQAFMINGLECFTLYCIYEVRYRLKHWMTLVSIAVILSILGLMGLIGNTFVIAVFVRSKVKQTSIYFMFLLAIIDLMACCIVIPGIIVYEWRFKFHDDFLCKFWEFFRYFTIPTSAMVLVAIAFERFFIICLSPKKLSNTVAKMIIMFIVGFGISLGIPPVLGMGVFTKNSRDNSLINYGYCIQNYLHISIDDLERYWYFVTAIFLIMIISIIFLYSAIFFTILKQKRKWYRRKITQVYPNNVRDSTVNRSKLSQNGLTGNGSCATVSKFPQIFTIKAQESRTEGNSMHNREDDGGNMSTLCVIKNSTEVQIDRSIVKEQTGCSIRRMSQGSIHLAHDTQFQSRSKRCSLGNLKSAILGSTETAGAPPNQNSELNNPVSNERTGDGDRNKEQGTRQLGFKRMHVKTTQVLFMVTMVYIISYLPTLLMSHNLIPGNRVVYLLYFINNTANPIIYSFMNPRFRQELWKLLKCKSTEVTPDKSTRSRLPQSRSGATNETLKDSNGQQ